MTARWPSASRPDLGSPSITGPLDARSSPLRAELAARHGVGAVDLAEAAARARVLLLAVKPQDIDTLLGLLAPHITAEPRAVCTIRSAASARGRPSRIPASTMASTRKKK